MSPVVDSGSTGVALLNAAALNGESGCPSTVAGFAAAAKEEKHFITSSQTITLLGARSELDSSGAQQPISHACKIKQNKGIYQVMTKVKNFQEIAL